MCLCFFWILWILHRSSNYDEKKYFLVNSCSLKHLNWPGKKSGKQWQLECMARHLFQIIMPSKSQWCLLLSSHSITLFRRRHNAVNWLIGLIISEIIILVLSKSFIEKLKLSTRWIILIYYSDITEPYTHADNVGLTLKFARILPDEKVYVFIQTSTLGLRSERQISANTIRS